MECWRPTHTRARTHALSYLHASLLIVSAPPHMNANLHCCCYGATLAVAFALTHFPSEWRLFNHTRRWYCRLTGQKRTHNGCHTHNRSTDHSSCSRWCNGGKDTHPAPNNPIQTPMLNSSCGWDLKQSLQASGKVKEARVIAVTYLGGKMFVRVPSVLFSDALGHEIVPLSTLASPKPKSIAHPQPGELPFLHGCFCTPRLSVCLRSPVRMFIWVLVNVCVCEGERRMGGCWVSAGPLHSSLTDRISERALQWLRAAWRTAAEWSLRISRQNQERDGNRAGGQADLRTVDQVLLGKNHINICSSIIHILIEECVFVCVDGVCVFQSCLLAWLMNWWISWLMTLSHMGNIHVQYVIGYEKYDPVQSLDSQYPTHQTCFLWCYMLEKCCSGDDCLHCIF